VQGNTKALVVGTTTDYIEWIRKSNPERALFLTDPTVRRGSQDPNPSPGEEILCDLNDYGRVFDILPRYLSREGLRAGGVACFDCESMELAALLAQKFSLPYPSVLSVNSCRNKFLSKALWERHKLLCPSARLIRSVTDAMQFFRELGGTFVLKPISGSGSELVFHCGSEGECETNFHKIQSGLLQRRTNRLYRAPAADPAILAEAVVGGDEFSCDFIIENGRVEVIRLTRKILSPQGPFGTARGYLLSSALPDEIDEGNLLRTIYQSAAALGINRAICMLDFMIDHGRIILLELAPRPGGDCLPFLLRRCWNLDVLKLTLDFCEQRPFYLQKPSGSSNLFLGLRIHALNDGILKRIDVHDLEKDSRVREIRFYRRPGQLVRMPPDDYDSWVLGHIIAELECDREPQSQCEELLGKISVEIE